MQSLALGSITDFYDKEIIQVQCTLWCSVVVSIEYNLEVLDNLSHLWCSVLSDFG